MILKTGRYSIPVDSKNIGSENTSIAERSYFHFLQKRPKLLDHKRECFEYLLEDIREVKTVFELFGGIGLITTILDHRFNLDEHTILDHDKYCYNHLRDTFKHKRVLKEDSLQFKDLKEVDFLSADFNSWSLLRANKEYQSVTKRIFKSGSKYIHITDAAGNKLHLHYKTYSKFSRQPIESTEDYICYGIEYLAEKFGYKLVRWKQCGSFYYLFERI